MIRPLRSEVVYGALARMAGLALVLLTVAFQRRGSIHWTEVCFLGLCIALQEIFLRLPVLRRYRSAMLVCYSLLPLALIAARAQDIMQHKGEFVPLILHTPLPLVFVSIQIMVSESTIGRLRGQVLHYRDTGIPLVVTYHPAYLLRSPQAKAKSWQDLCLIRKLIGPRQ
jgi:hypothetical protein